MNATERAHLLQRTYRSARRNDHQQNAMTSSAWHARDGIAQQDDAFMTPPSRHSGKCLIPKRETSRRVPSDPVPASEPGTVCSAGWGFRTLPSVQGPRPGCGNICERGAAGGTSSAPTLERAAPPGVGTEGAPLGTWPPNNSLSLP